MHIFHLGCGVAVQFNSIQFISHMYNNHQQSYHLTKTKNKVHMMDTRKTIQFIKASDHTNIDKMMT